LSEESTSLSSSNEEDVAIRPDSTYPLSQSLPKNADPENPIDIITKEYIIFGRYAYIYKYLRYIWNANKCTYAYMNLILIFV